MWKFSIRVLLNSSLRFLQYQNCQFFHAGLLKLMHHQHMKLQDWMLWRVLSFMLLWKLCYSYTSSLEVLHSGTIVIKLPAIIAISNISSELNKETMLCFRLYCWKKVRNIVTDLILSIQMLSRSGQKWRKTRISQDPNVTTS